MALNAPGPYEVVYRVIVSAMEHEMRFNCVALGSPAPGTPFNTITFATRTVGVPVNAQTAIDGLWNQMRPHYHTSVTCGLVELWHYPVPGSDERDFISATSPVATAGTSSGAAVLANQDTLSFRSANGGIMKVTMMESSFQTNNVVTLIPNASGNTVQKIAAYVLSSVGWLLARDDGFPFAAYQHTSGQNEAIYKKRYRPNA